MKKKILSSSITLLLLYFFSNCKSGNSFDDSSIAKDSVTIKKGQTSFGSKCSGCHNFAQNGIGPELSGITSDNSVNWIRNFIKDPKKVIESGDSSANKLFKRYKAIMPSFASLPDEEIDAIIAYIHTKKKQVRILVPEDTNDIKNPIPDSIRTSDLVVGVDSFTQIPPSSEQAPLTRIIKLDYQPNTGELYVLDIRGKLYKLQEGKPKVFLDLASLKPNFITQ